MNEKQSTLHERVIVLETQVGRIISDIESEKGTRSRTNERLDARIVKLEKSMWMAAGALAFLEFVNMVIKH
jgi:hypothetical protein